MRNSRPVSAARFPEARSACNGGRDYNDPRGSRSFKRNFRSPDTELRRVPRRICVRRKFVLLSHVESRSMETLRLGSPYRTATFSPDEFLHFIDYSRLPCVSRRRRVEFLLLYSCCFFAEQPAISSDCLGCRKKSHNFDLKHVACSLEISFFNRKSRCTGRTSPSDLNVSSLNRKWPLNWKQRQFQL